MADDDFPHGRRYYAKSGYLTALDNQAIDRLLDAVATIPSSETMIELAYLYDPQNFFRLNQNVPPRGVAAEGSRIDISPP